MFGHFKRILNGQNFVQFCHLFCQHERVSRVQNLGLLFIFEVHVTSNFNKVQPSVKYIKLPVSTINMYAVQVLV